MKRSDILLIAVFLAFCTTVSLRIAYNKNRYITPDSKHYLRSVKNYMNGEGFVVPNKWPFQSADKKVRIAMWPLGYPMCILLTNKITGVRLLYASKIVNLLFFGFSLLLLRKLFGSETWFVALVFFGITSMEIFSFTWSEGPFIFFSLWSAYIMIKWSELKFNWLWLTICLIGAFMIRYAAVIYFFQFSSLLLYLWLKKKKFQFKLLVPLVLSSAFVLGYLYFNKLENGQATGMDRFARDGEGFFGYLIMFGKGLFNELFLAKNYYFVGEPALLFVCVSAIQLSAGLFIILKSGSGPKISFKNEWDQKCLLILCTALFYLVGISIIRAIIIFDPLDYRILSPFSILAWISVFGMMVNPIRAQRFTIARWIVTVFMIGSLVLNLPLQALF